MRRWFVLLMIVLLPVRGWAGDAMGIQMTMASTASMAMPADCAMHASAERGNHHGGEAPADQSLTKCTSCQLCTPAAQLPCSALPLAHAPARSQPIAGRAEFASASLAQAVEPPIS